MLQGYSIKTILILFIIITSCIWLYQLPIFGTGDDVIMMFMTSGFFGSSTNKVVLSHFLIGSLFQTLFSYSQSFNWYTITYFTLEVFSITLLIINLTNKLNNKNKWAIFLAIWSIFLPLILKMQFTSVAYICGISGVIAFNKYLKYHEPFNKISGLSLFIICSLIRWEVGVSLIIIWTSYYSFQFYKLRKLKVFKAPTLFFVCVIIINSTNIIYYQGEEENFLIYNEKREALMDYPNQLIKEETLVKFDWSLNDFNLLKDWNWIDTKVYNKEKIASLATEVNTNRNISDAFGTIKMAIKRMQRYFLIFIPASLFLIYLFWQGIAYFIYTGLWMINIIVLLSVFAKLPFHVFYPLLICFPLLHVQQKELSKKAPINEILLAVISVFTIAISTIFIKSRFDNISVFRESFQSNIEYIKANPNKTFIFLGGGTIPWNYSYMLTSPLQYTSYNMLITRWHIYTETYEEFLKAKNIDNPMIEIVNNSSIIVVHPKKEIIQSFMQEHYNINIDFKKVENIDYLKSPSMLEVSYYIIEK